MTLTTECLLNSAARARYESCRADVGHTPVVERPTTRASPPAAVLAAFGLVGSPVPLPGGQGTTWRVGEAVVKPLDMEPSLVQWQGALLSRLDGRDDFRVSVPLQTTDRQWTINGWTAWRYQPGAHVPQRWHDIVAVGRRLHTALRSEPEPLPASTGRQVVGWRQGRLGRAARCRLRPH